MEIYESQAQSMKTKKHKVKIPEGYELWSQHEDKQPDAIHITSVFTPIKKELANDFNDLKLWEALPEFERETFYEFEIEHGHRFKMNNQVLEFDSILSNMGRKIKIRAKLINGDNNG